MSSWMYPILNIFQNYLFHFFNGEIFNECSFKQSLYRIAYFWKIHWGLASMCIKSKIAMLPENLTMTLFLWLLEHSFVCSVEKEQVSWLNSVLYIWDLNTAFYEGRVFLLVLLSVLTILVIQMFKCSVLMYCPAFASFFLSHCLFLFSCLSITISVA